MRRDRSIEKFLARGLASAARAKESGRYVSAAAVVGKLSQRIAEAKKRLSATEYKTV